MSWMTSSMTVSYFDMNMWIRVLTTFTVLMAVTAGAFAVDLDQAKADGLVGERADGYLGLVVTNASSEVKALVEEINAKRKAQYARIAERNGIDVGEVAVLAGRKTIEKTPSGGWIFVTEWERKR